ncbi:uncharacterized protein [Littorina saxatilis]|uniref:Interleukin-6 n=1 Tax=Littorina saxatilis TaxID=31220 RepID=A0AAN9BQM2_9CAEN
MRSSTNMKMNTAAFRTSALAMFSLLIGVTSSFPHQGHSSPVTSDGWLIPSQPGAEKSHLIMWMMTEKQLAPRISGLAESALELLTFACQREGHELLEDCLDFAASLPNVSGIDDVLSQQVLQSEQQKQFVKVLVENAYHSLEQLHSLLENYVFSDAMDECKLGSKSDLPSEICHIFQHFRRSLRIATRQYRDLITSFYKIKLAPASTKDLQVDVDEDQVNEQETAIKALYVAVNRLNEISSVLEYSVEFSWFSRFERKSKRGGRGGIRKKSRKNRKVQ